MINENQYVQNRLQNRGNDKGLRSKLNDDAKLRGSLGTNKANRLIRAIDVYKTGCSSFDRFGDCKY